METNPSSHSFEYEDVCLLRVMNCRLPLAISDLCTEAKAEPADTRKRIMLLTSIGHVELVGYDMDLHTGLYAITEGGKKLLECIDRLRGSIVDNRGQHLFPQAMAQRVKDLAKVKPRRTPRSSKAKACLYCGADSNRGMNGMSWCSQKCFRKDNHRWDTVWLWELGIRVDDDMLIGAGRIHESEKQDCAS